ncbi:Rha family transcriptional regulator [Sutterella wadsworthensis]|uniref:Rha family transcriptional regulator n=2 Tax=Sutterella wadsworthensis TaxID=40545 RepID=UPI0020536BAD|nr:MAG TPA: regulatory protein [Caudoviricetes sp.]
MSQIIAANAFKVVEGRPVTSSRIVAEYFGKQHHHVVRDIRTLISQKPDLERNANFGECSETINLANGATRQVPFFWMDRKGFSLLAMGFTGAKALDFKCAFYDQFERMEEALRAPSDQSALITTTEQYEIRKTIKSRAKNSSVHYQTVYNALYDYFKIASYKDLRHDQMKAALTLIETCTLKPQLPAPTLAEGSVILSAQEAEALLTFIYYVRFLFADVFGKLDGLLRIVDSPLAGSFWDAFHEVSWGRILEILAKHGHDINDMPCYQHWSSCQPKRKAA